MQPGPLPPGFALDDEPPKKRRASKKPDAPPPGFVRDDHSLDTITSPIDGDTYRLGSGDHLRLWGADAPELGQRGYSRSGASTDLGAIAKGAAAANLASGGSSIGPEVGRSYGRVVAPVSANGGDLGQSLIRSGNALAVPEYLASDPQRRFDYLQAERLARANQLGPMNDYYTIRPDQFRHDRDWVPERETVARFFDTPTPYSGLTADQEAEWLRLNREGSVEDLVAYADANGFATDPEIAKRWVEYRDKERAEGREVKPTVNYDLSRLNAPPVLTDDGRGQLGAAVREGVQGFMAGGLDEGGAVFDLLGATPDRANIWNSDDRWADLWARNRAQNASLLGHDESAYPTTSTVAQLGGAFLQPFPGGKFNSFRKLAGWGGASAGAEGFLGTEGDWTDRATAAAIQTPIGVVVGGLGGKAIEAATPYVSRMIGRAAQGVEKTAGPHAADVPSPPSGFTLDRADQTIGMDAETMPSVSVPARQRDYIETSDAPRPHPLDRPLTSAQIQAVVDDITPRDVLPIPSNEVADMAEAAAIDEGRVVAAKAVNERTELSKQTIRNYAGVEVPKVGPVDMVGWLRTQGGLADQGDELAQMGIINNASRKGLEHVGQEHRFGPMLNERGLTLDEAADRAWREGYFPDHTERPTTNEFLDALRDTYEGTNRRWLPDDMPQLDRYDAARDDRLDLERRIAEDGPLYQDRSAPADEPSPFPPVAAYEEWPAGGPDFAGNINLSKLESPQDIKRALSRVNNSVGFDAATRGRVRQAETERLANELGMTPDALLARRKGRAFNAEEALAARQLLAKSTTELVNAARKVQRLENPGDDLLAEFRHKLALNAAIQEQVAGMTAEAGRTLAQFKMLANSRAVKGDVLGALVKRGGGADNLKDAADTLLEAVETSPGKFNADVRELVKPTWRQRVSEFYINSLLSGPQTHVVNMVSNTLTSMAQIPEFATASAIGGVRRAVARQPIDRVTGGEVGARAFGLLQGAKEGAKLFARALRSGEASDFVSKVEGEQYKAIPGLAGEIIRVPTRFLTAEDELFKGVARRMELNAQAVRIATKEGLKGDRKAQRIAELVAEPTDEMVERALDYGRYLTFQRPLGSFASKVAGLTDTSTAPGFALKFFLPFVRTPTNLLKFALERSPAAPLLKEWRKDFRAGGASRDLAIARATIGTGIGLTIFQMAKQGQITGSPPSDPKKARLLYADGWQPYSVKVGDKWYSYKRLDPFATTLGVAADMATLPEGMSVKQKEDKATLLVASIMGNLASKTWLSGVSDLVSALDEPDRYADNMLQRLVGSFLVPSGVGQTARTIDPVQRESEAMGDAIKSRVPGLSADLLPRRDVWGNPIRSEGGVGPDFLSPIWVSTQLRDPVNSELLQLDYAPGYPSRKVGGRELSADDYDRYLRIAGSLSHERLMSLVTAPQWRGFDPDERTKLAQRTVEKAREDARSQLFGAGPSGSTPAPSADVPPAYMLDANAPAPPPPGFVVDR